MRELPEGWAEVALGEVWEESRTRVLPETIPPTRYIGLEHVEGGTNRIIGEGTTGNVKSTVAVFSSGDVLYGRLRPYLNKVIHPSFDGAASTEFLVFNEGDALSNQFLLHLLSSSDVVAHANAASSGVNLPRVAGKKLGEFRLGLPPPPEQNRIVARIEVLFTRLDDCVAALERAEANLKRHRASVLKAAVEGRLTERWRSDNPPDEPGEELLRRILGERRKRWEEEQLAAFAAKGRKPPQNWKSKYREPVAPDAGRVPELPTRWCWATVDQVARIASGQTPKGAVKLAKSSGPIPWYRVGDMTLPGNGRKLHRSRTYFTRDQISRLGFKLLPPSSFVFPKRGGAIATNKKRKLRSASCVDLNIMALIPPTALRSWIWLWFQTVNLASIGDGSNVPQINNHDILPLALPLPPVAEQKAIGDRLGTFMDTWDESLAQVTKIREATGTPPPVHPETRV